MNHHNGLDMPIIRVELDHVRQHLLYALNRHTQIISDSFDEAIRKLDIEKIIEQKVAEDAPRIIESAVTKSIEDNVHRIVGDVFRETGWYGEFGHDLRKQLQQSIVQKFIDHLGKEDNKP